MISILLPLYNGFQFIDECISSVLAQTHADWELIIGINGHTDKGAQEIATKIRSFNEPRIRAFNSSKQSKVITLRAIAKQARGKIICLLDVDDTWVPTKLADQLPFITKYDVIAGDVEYSGDGYGSPRLVLGKVHLRTFGYQNPIINSMVMMRKVDAIWQDSWESIDDLSLWIHLLKQNKTFYNVPKVLGYHRIHKGSYFNNKNDDVGQKLRATLPQISEEEKLEYDRIIEERDWKE